jgi:predicted membrane channel-forming protein YqfA (hemolysin III family)
MNYEDYGIYDENNHLKKLESRKKKISVLLRRTAPAQQDYVFGIFMGIALLSLFSAMMSSENLNCLGTTFFIVTSLIGLFMLSKLVQHKMMIVEQGLKINHD